MNSVNQWKLRDGRVLGDLNPRERIDQLLKRAEVLTAKRYVTRPVYRLERDEEEMLDMIITYFKTFGDIRAYEKPQINLILNALLEQEVNRGVICN